MNITQTHESHVTNDEDEKRYIAHYALQKSELETNYSIFKETHLDELMKEHQGEYALMKGGKLLKVYVTTRDAVMEGNKLFSDRIFSVHKITNEIAVADYGIYSRI